MSECTEAGKRRQNVATTRLSRRKWLVELSVCGLCTGGGGGLNLAARGPSYWILGY
jgi:hypothetical protein